MSADKTFVDSNILLYAYDVSAGARHERAIESLDQLWLNDSGSVSLQVLQEFYVNATRKLKVPLAKARARDIVQRFAEWDPVRPDLEMVVDATRLAERRKLSFWDALIVLSAREARATILYSEDFAAGTTIEGVRVVNPLVG